MKSYGVDVEYNNTSSKDEANYYLLDNYKYSNQKKEAKKENTKPMPNLQERGKFFKNADNEDKSTPALEMKVKFFEKGQKPIRNFEKGQKYAVKNLDNKENEVLVNPKEKIVKRFNRF